MVHLEDSVCQGLRITACAVISTKLTEILAVLPQELLDF
jgi:hypothetical protein